ncbi:sensor domain-containing diguanylate cyclase [Sulfurospirillum arcachonense]|uniref:sensor domain-containing diguanylate cyclase n=1 Tax=Sulfurospirillum arcachonense TaxID=57666 RepID=UPI000468F3B0|nr:cache domain-containing protein [Sulfurospirillum arcachonense]
MEKHENKILKLITLLPLITIPLCMGLVIFTIIGSLNNNLNNMVKNVENNFINTQKESVKDKVHSMVDLINHKNSIILKKLKDRIEDRVLTAHKISTVLYEQYKDVKTPDEIKQLIITTLRPLQWNNQESFIWILDYNGIFELAPKYLRHLEGSSILNFKDSSGRYIIKEEIQLCKTKGQGFLTDTFTKPNDITKKSYKQIAFVKSFGHYDWYMGSAEYLDTATKKSNKELLKSIEKISLNTNGYLFIINTQGETLLNPINKKLLNTNVHDLDNKFLKDTYAKFIKSLQYKNETFILYKWKNNQTKKLEKKLSYISKIPNTNWIIGSGFYASSIKNITEKEINKLRDDYNLKIQYSIFIGVIAILISLIVSYFISRYIKTRFLNYQNNIIDKTKELKELNTTLEHKVQNRTIELEKHKKSLEVLATTDALTKVHNRYSIMQILIKEIDKANKSELPLCILMYDIDHFKSVNDTYGHDIGDEVLIDMTKVIQKSLREIDLLGRYGGEEFIIILPNTTLNDANIIAQRMRRCIEKHKFRIEKKVTISIGLVQHQKNEKHEDLFKRLDNLLYKSKASGRNTLSS